MTERFNPCLQVALRAVAAIAFGACAGAADIDEWYAAPDSPAGRSAFSRIAADPANLAEARQMAAAKDPALRARAAVLLAALLKPTELVREIARPETDGIACRIYVAAILAPGNVPEIEPAAGAPPMDPIPPRLRGVATADLHAAAARLAHDPDWRTRCGAADLLAAARGAEVSPLHRELLNDPAWPVRARAIEALGALSSTAGVAVAAAYLDQADPRRLDDRLAAVCALARAGAWKEVLRAFSDHAPDVQRLAVGVLMQAPVLTAALREALPEQVRRLRDRQARSAAGDLIRRLEEEKRGMTP